ncbi:hypothetical protein [Aliiruegeria lutimaris]|uniref:Uncharacterized protein n=1 Tax=Aliiruegeria lutimaris TaxID=571298 RepID=A0A1G8VIA7_9RHOB|nr:hypothetical protein [Aliiruegeria lutimaris]SDJ65768.1 hypothetical protein SAMN04488026_102157 [Aliiruegeria lutimaris]
MSDALSFLEREVSSTLAEYAHGLRLSFPEGVSGGPTDFVVTDDRARLEIQLEPGPDRVIALMRLPTLTARLRFTGGTQEERKALLKRMDLAMRRGGG